MIFKKGGTFIRTSLTILFALATVVAFAFPNDALASQKKKSAGNPLYASIVVDSDTGVIIHQSNPDKKLHPASLTKVMTLLLLFDAMDAGRIGLNDTIAISKRAAAASPSKIGIPAGGSIRVKDAILALVTKSANDIAIAVAEHVGGTEDRFAIMMTGRARELGMNNTTFRNASGLHNPGQISTARDMAIMARYVINRYPDYYRYFSTQNFNYKGHNYHNHNHLMKSYKGMDGMKTGFIKPSGFNLIASAVRGNTRLIGVVFGGRSATSRNAHMKELLDRSFSGNTAPVLKNASLSETYEGLPPVRSHAPLPGRKPGAAAPAMAFASAAPLTGHMPGQLNAADSVPPPVLKGESQLAGANPVSDIPPNTAAVQKMIGAKLASLNSSLQTSPFSEMMGQGDYDLEQAKRIETGMIAIAAHTGQSLSAPKGPILRAGGQLENPVALAAFAPAPLLKDDLTAAARQPGTQQTQQTWAIQIGAFTSRVATDLAIKKTQAKLPAHYAAANPIIVPLRTQEGWLFRGRLSGFESEKAAAAACAFLSKDCLPVSPYE